MGEQVGLAELVGVVGEALLADAVVGGLAVLEALAAGDVGEREQEVVGVVVVRLVLGVGLADEGVDLGEGLGTDVGVVGLVGDDVEVVGGLDLGGERELVEVLAGDDGRVFELLDVGDGVLGGHGRGGCGVVLLIDAGVGGRGDGTDGLQRGAGAPAGGNGEAGLNRDVLGRDVGRVEEQLLPLEDRHLGGDAGRGDAVEVGVQGGHAGGDGDVELVEVLVVAAPGQDLTVGGEDDAGDVIDGAGGAVVAGDPLGGDEGDGAGLDRDLDLGVVEVACALGEVGGDLDGVRLGGRCLGEGERGQKGGREQKRRTAKERSHVQEWILSRVRVSHSSAGWDGLLLLFDGWGVGRTQWIE